MWSSHILLSNFTTICSFFLLSSVIAHVAKWVEGSSHYSDPAAYLEIGVDRYGKLCKYFTKFCAELAIAEDDVCNHQDEGTNKTRQAFILYFLFFISCYFFFIITFFNYRRRRVWRRGMYRHGMHLSRLVAVWRRPTDKGHRQWLDVQSG